MRKLGLLVAMLAAMSACSSASPGDSKEGQKAITLALGVPLSANSPQGKTLGDCLAKNGYGVVRKDLADSVQPRPLDGGETVYRISFYGDDTLSVGVVLQEQAVGGWKPEDVTELETLGCFINGPDRLNLS